MIPLSCRPHPIVPVLLQNSVLAARELARQLCLHRRRILRMVEMGKWLESVSCDQVVSCHWPLRR
ncbi:hypothetical protein HMPREF1275_00892 [Propionibacterium sp. KPL1844]|nr:hypothetical protein HMPREF1275_00892 [Propionibacterium sp. KPL1844]